MCLTSRICERPVCWRNRVLCGHFQNTSAPGGVAAPKILPRDFLYYVLWVCYLGNKGEPVFIWVCKVAVASILARPNGPALGAQRSFKYQTAFVVRGACFRPGNQRSRATPRPHDLFPAQAPQYHISARVESYC